MVMIEGLTLVIVFLRSLAFTGCCDGFQIRSELMFVWMHTITFGDRPGLITMKADHGSQFPVLVSYIALRSYELPLSACTRFVFKAFTNTAKHYLYTPIAWIGFCFPSINPMPSILFLWWNGVGKDCAILGRISGMRLLHFLIRDLAKLRVWP